MLFTKSIYGIVNINTMKTCFIKFEVLTVNYWIINKNVGFE